MQEIYNKMRFLNEAEKLIREAGQIILSVDRKGQDGEETLGVEEKSKEQTHVNFVTQYDSQLQQYLTAGFSKLLPEAAFLAEEDGASTGYSDNGYCFVIDPIDGTANFIHDYHRSAISVGLLLNGISVYGAIFDPYMNELFTAVKGQGAFVNGKRIHVSDRTLDRSVISFGSSPYYKEELGERTARAFRSLLFHASDIRRSGSAAIDLASVASGRTDGFMEARLSPWDFAAGYLLITEAGGTVTDMDGKALQFDKTQSVLCGGTGNYKALLELLSKT